MKLTESGEVNVKTTKPQEVAFAVHKGSYQKLGAVFGKLAQWIEENGYEIAGPSVTVCYKDPHTTPEEELVSECQFPVEEKRIGVREKDDWGVFWREKSSLQRAVYTKYCRYPTKRGGYMKFGYTDVR